MTEGRFAKIVTREIGEYVTIRREEFDGYSIQGEPRQDTRFRLGIEAHGTDKKIAWLDQYEMKQLIDVLNAMMKD